MTTKPITIRFSHSYFKLSGDKTAKLLAVFSTHYDQLGKDFIEFDTKFTYWNADKHDLCEGHYPLPHTDLLVLLLQDSHGLFTTVRSKVGRGGLDKEEYYRKHIGQQFDVIITEELK